ncbi:MAG: hypothetical protein QOF73_1820 [Thermomicrobiales bacterium]|nr:hypothetical protein [Thermomicrobiales bacterium]
MTDSLLRGRFSDIVSSAATRAKQVVAARTKAAPPTPPTTSPSGIRRRIEIAVRDEGFEAAERVIQTYEAELWAGLAKVAEPLDPPRALTYAHRAVALDPRLTYVRRLLRLSNRLGELRPPERVLETALAREEEAPEFFHQRLRWLRVWRGFLEHGFPIPDKRSRREIDPLPDTVIYCMHNSLPHDSSGYATRSHGLLTSLQAAGMNVRAYTRFGYPWDSSRRQKIEPLTDFPDEDVVDGITYHRLRTLEAGWGQVSVDRYMEAYADELERVARIERPAVIHAASNFMVGIPAVVAARRLGLPVIYEVRGMWEVTRESREPAWKDSEQYEAYVRLETQAATGADAVITLTEALKAELIRRGVPAERITVVPNSVDPDQFAALPRDCQLEQELGLVGKRTVGYVGSFTQYEGLDDLLHAAGIAIDRGLDDLRLLLVGDGLELPRLRDLVTDLELQDHVIMPGRVPFADVQRYYSLIDVAAFPRKPLPVTEMVSPMKPFEAMAMEKAILVSSVGALAEIVRDGETGVVFEKGDVDSLVAAIERMVADPGLCARLGKNAREWVVANRSWERAARTTTDLYRKVQGAN